MTKAVDERLLALEEITAHQAKSIEEMSAELAEMGERQIQLEKALKVLAKRLAAAEESLAPDTPIAKPPHW